MPATLGCPNSDRRSQHPDGRWKLVLGGYSALREPYRDLIGRFKEHWEKKTGTEVMFEESYLGSGMQSRAIAEGFEADVAALSLEADMDRLVDARLITRDWRATQNRGIASLTVVALAVRKGNPKNIRDWSDLARPGIEILTPDPSTSGGAMWNALALYGAARRTYAQEIPADADAAALAFLASVMNNVKTMDKDARESIERFDRGEGDVAITYETEIRGGRLYRLQDYEMVLPRSTISVDNPVAVIDAHAAKHGVAHVASAFVEFLFTHEAQVIFTDHGWRSIDAAVQNDVQSRYPKIEDLWTIESMGGWKKVMSEFFGEQGIYRRALRTVSRSGD